ALSWRRLADNKRGNSSAGACPLRKDSSRLQQLQLTMTKDLFQVDFLWERAKLWKDRRAAAVSAFPCVTAAIQSTPTALEPPLRPAAAMLSVTVSLARCIMAPRIRTSHLFNILAVSGF